jgi:hypothetical protein
MILEGLGPEKVRALALIAKVDGKVRRSNYNALVPDAKGTGIFWKTMDWMEAEQLVIRAGSTYLLTSEGLALVAEASRRERNRRKHR